MISVVIISWYRTDELERAIESCISKINVEKEFIIIDNSNCEDTKIMISNLRKRYGDEKIIFETEQENLGVSGGRNRGWELSTSDYVLFLDDDAIIENVSCDFEELLEVFSTNPNVSICAPYITNPEMNLVLKSRTSRVNQNCVISFIGACSIINKKRVSLKKLYPNELIYGHEDLFLSLQNRKLDYNIFYDERLKVAHFPSKKRDSMINEIKKGIINKYVVKRVCFPRLFSPIIFLAFLYRNIMFWKSDTKEIRDCISSAKKLKKCLKDVSPLSIKQSLILLNEFGIDYLWEISHSKSDKLFFKYKNRINYNAEGEQ